MIQPCCNAEHLFDKVGVLTNWWPSAVRCLIIGETPGTPGNPYFYTSIPEYQTDPAEVRRYLFPTLAEAKLIASPTLPAFREAGFVFDYAVRCQLDKKTVEVENKLAVEYASTLSHLTIQLRPLIKEAPKIWIMGHLARDTVTHLCSLTIRFDKNLAPCYEEADRIFVSQYLNRWSKTDHKGIVIRFKEFLAK